MINYLCDETIIYLHINLVSILHTILCTTVIMGKRLAWVMPSRTDT
jgi:hypothetical protein